jgi:pimeloyl-ACP methyl ester carboxylesterase
LNYIPGIYDPITLNNKFSDEEKEFLISEEDWYKKEGGYSHQQRTKPLTLAYSLNDSPVGLCAWIVEKLRSWADCEGNIESIFTKEELLANVTLYWLTETIHSSIRLYNENNKVKFKAGNPDKIMVPAGIARFRFEEPFPPRRYVERGFRVIRWTDFPSGGHFPAMEKPQALAEDILGFFSEL